MTYELTNALGFEVKTCTRCGGSGQYSYNQVDGSRCYGCAGCGKQYTPRGKATKLFWDGLCKVLPASVEVGDRINNFGTKFTVASIDGVVESHKRKAADGSWEPVMAQQFTSVSGKQYLAPVGYPVKLIPQGAKGEKMLAEALAYQDSLTNAGKPRKRG